MRHVSPDEVTSYCGGTQWTPEDDQTLLRLIGERASAAEAGVVLNRSRNSVLGRAMRLGVSFRGGGQQTIRPQKKRTEATGEALMNRLFSRARSKGWREKPAENEDRSRAMPFIEALGMPVCKWFLSGEAGANGLICGHGIAAPGKPYCTHHMLRRADMSGRDDAAA